MKLILIRHAKSGWDNPMLDDFDRTLTDRGLRDAARMGEWLRNNGHIPDVTLCSAAQRTRETAGTLELPGETDFVDALYLASPDVLLRHIRKQSAPCVAVIAHNPGIADLAALLVSTPPDAPRFSDYPTSATTVLSFDIDDWSDMKTGDLVAFRTPHDSNA
nr:histidine phosphatase family protein [Loktanella sp. SALINAS62]